MRGNKGIITAQGITEPLTQASLSSFHFLSMKSPKEIVESLERALQGNYDVIDIDIDKSTFDPVKNLKINLFSLIKVIQRRVTRKDVDWGEKLVSEGILKSNLYRELYGKRIYSLVISKDPIYDIVYVCYYLRKRDPGHEYVIRNDWRIIDILSTKTNINMLNYIIYEKQEGVLVPYQFSSEEYANEDSSMRFSIHECKIIHLCHIPEIQRFIFRDYEKICKYYGIEALKLEIRNNVKDIIKNENHLRFLVDRLTRDGTFNRGRFKDHTRWLDQSLLTSSEEDEEEESF